MKTVENKIALTDDEKIQIGRRLGERIRKVATEKKKVGEIYDVGLGRQLSKIVDGGNPTLQTIYLFAKAIGVHPRELFDYDDSKKIKFRKDFKELEDYWEYRKIHGWDK